MDRITSVDVYLLRLPMKRSFRISGGTVGAAPSGALHLYVRITADNGLCGWGEARPSPRWSYETPETAAAVIDRYWKPLLLGQPVDDLASVSDRLSKEVAGGLHPGHPIAQAAIDTALHDLLARTWGRPLAALWQSVSVHPVRLSHLISTDDPKAAEAEAEWAVSHGYAGIDVKIGLNKSKDQDVLEAISSKARGLFIRADANQAYRLHEAMSLARVMERLGVSVFEQPMPAQQLSAHAELRRRVSIPIALDESIWTVSGLLEAIRTEACDIAVIKLTKMGGLRHAKLCGELARECGLGLLGGGLTESKLGFLAAARLFQYLQMEAPVDLNGPFFLQDDPVAGDWPMSDGGLIQFPDGPGLGCTVDEVKLGQYREDR